MVKGLCQRHSVEYKFDLSVAECGSAHPLWGEALAPAGTCWRSFHRAKLVRNGDCRLRDSRKDIFTRCFNSWRRAVMWRFLVSWRKVNTCFWKCFWLIIHTEYEVGLSPWTLQVTFVFLDVYSHLARFVAPWHQLSSAFLPKCPLLLTELPKLILFQALAI